MLASYLQQFETLQTFLRSLFDCFDQVDLKKVSAAATLQNSQQIYSHLIKVLIEYGRKIMQLSQQSTYKYRNEHFLCRKDVEEEIAIIYRIIIGEQTKENYEKMIRVLIQKLQWERKSIWNKFSLPESRILSTEIKNDKEKVSLEEQKNSNLRTSKTKSKATKATSVKEVLQIKGYFQKQQSKIRQFFEKINKMLNTNNVTISSISPQHLKFSRAFDENNSQKIIDLIKSTTQNHIDNIGNLGNLTDILYDNLTKRLKNQGFAEGKLSMFVQEAQRMEEVYSYTLSKMLEGLSTIKLNVSRNPQVCISHVQNLEEITRKLYGLYPSQQSLKQINFKAKTSNEVMKNYGVQVNTNKNQQEKKTNTEVFRMQVRVNQCLQKFQRNNKFKKTFDLKEVQRLVESIRQIIPIKPPNSQADTIYQQQFKRISELQQKQQKQLTQSFTKKCKKYEKKIQELQQSITQEKKRIISLNQQKQHQYKKYTKKCESTQNQLKKIVKEKSILEANLSQYLKDIDQMKNTIKRKSQEQSYQRKMVEHQNQSLRSKLQNSNNKLTETVEECKLQKQRINQERSLYRQKIQLTQGQLYQQRQLTAGLRVELETIINDNQKMRDQLSEMSKIYEEKIREVEEMIENIKQLQTIKHSQEENIENLRKREEKYQNQIEKEHQDIKKYLDQIEKLQQQNHSLLNEIEHWKSQGKLTDSDLKMLKDEVEKVSAAYIETEEILDATKQQLSACTEQRQRLFRQKLKLNRLVEEQQTHLHALRTKYQSIELSQRDMKDQYYQKSQQIIKTQKELQEMKKEAQKNKKQFILEREEKAKIQKQLRQLRQQTQSRRQGQSIENGKRRLQIQNLRVQLRKKTEQLEKQRQSSEEKINLMTQKMKELEQFTGQKQLLSRLLQSHQSQ